MRSQPTVKRGLPIKGARQSQPTPEEPQFTNPSEAQSRLLSNASVDKKRFRKWEAHEEEVSERIRKDEEEM